MSSAKGLFYIIVVVLIAFALLGLSSGFLSSLGISTALDKVLGQPAMPTVSLPPERITGSVNILGFETGLTNTFVAMILVDIVLVMLALLATRKIRAGSQEAWVPRGLQNVFEWIVETLYKLADTVMGARAKDVFWLGATIFLLVLFANWMELIPGIDAVGWIEKPQEANVATYQKGDLLGIPIIKGPAIPPSDTTATSGTQKLEGQGGYILVPFVRAATTDLNLTLSLALIAMVMVQVYGFRTMGNRYLTKFVATSRLAQGQLMGLLDFFVGALESVSEFSKIISFTFRLFGNIFAGQVLLFVMGFLIPFVVVGILVFWGLEIFVGAIQAFVFMMLTFVFVAQAMKGHGGHA